MSKQKKRTGSDIRDIITMRAFTFVAGFPDIDETIDYQFTMKIPVRLLKYDRNIVGTFVEEAIPQITDTITSRIAALQKAYMFVVRENKRERQKDLARSENAEEGQGESVSKFQGSGSNDNQASKDDRESGPSKLHGDEVGIQQ